MNEMSEQERLGKLAYETYGYHLTGGENFQEWASIGATGHTRWRAVAASLVRAITHTGPRESMPPEETDDARSFGQLAYDAYYALLISDRPDILPRRPWSVDAEGHRYWEAAGAEVAAAVRTKDAARTQVDCEAATTDEPPPPPVQMVDGRSLGQMAFEEVYSVKDANWASMYDVTKERWERAARSVAARAAQESLAPPTHDHEWVHAPFYEGLPYLILYCRWCGSWVMNDLHQGIHLSRTTPPK